MRTPFWLIALVLAAAGGMAVGYVIAPRTGQAPRTPEISTESGPDREDSPPLADDDSPTEEDDTPAAPRSPGSEGERGKSGEANKPADGSLDELFDVKVPPALSGAGIITGRVVDEDGSPVPGVELRLGVPTSGLDMKRPMRGDYESEDEYIRARLRYEYGILKMQAGSSVTRTSDTNGEVVFDRLPEGKCQLGFTDKRYRVDGRFYSYSRPVEVGKSFELMLVRVYPVSVMVKGVPETARSCRLSWSPVSNDGFGNGASFKPGKVKFVYLPEGDYDLTAEVRQPSLSGGPVRVTVTPSDTPQPVELSVHRDASIYGKLRFPGPRPLHYQVLAARVIGGASDEQLLGGSRSSSPHRAQFDYDTREFQFEEGLKGEYAVGVVSGAILLASARVTVGDEPVKLELVIERSSHAYSLKVVVKRPGGTRRTNERINVTSFESGRQLREQVWLDDDDNYLLVFGEPDPSYPWPDTAYVNVTGHELGHLREPFTPGTDREVTFEFAEPVEVRLWVGNVPEGLRRAYLLISKAPFFDDVPPPTEHPHRPTTRPRQPRHVASNIHLNPHEAASKPGARIGNFQPGGYRILFRREGHDSIPYARFEFVIKEDAGSQLIEIELPELHDIQIDGSACPPYPHAGLRHIGYNSYEHFIFSDNIALFRNLPPGEYEVTYRPNGIQGAKRTMKFTLPGTETVVLTE